MGFSRKKFIDIFLGGSLLAWLGSILYPVASYLVPPKAASSNVNTVKAGKVNDFEPNSGKIIKFGRKPVLLVRKENGEFKALSAVCTHLDCIVQYKNDSKRIYCACHNGLYDLNGQNVSGPPPRPLTEYDVNIVKDEVIISKPKQA